MTKGKVRKIQNSILKRKTAFDRVARVDLWEIDHELFDKDDKLGSFIIRPGQKADEYKHEFTVLNGFSRPPCYYTLRYRIDR